MRRCDVHFKEVRASFVTSAPAALGIFRVENKHAGNVWNATWPFNPTRRRGFSQIPSGPCWRAQLSRTQQTGAKHCCFSKPRPCCTRCLPPQTSTIWCACVAPLRPPSSPLPHESMKPEPRVRWLEDKCKLGLLSKLPLGVAGKRPSSSLWCLAFENRCLWAIMSSVIWTSVLLLLLETFSPFWDVGLFFFGGHATAMTAQNVHVYDLSVFVQIPRHK